MPYIVRNKHNPALILTASNTWKLAHLCGPGGHQGRVFRTEAGAALRGIPEVVQEHVAAVNPPGDPAGDPPREPPVAQPRARYPDRDDSLDDNGYFKVPRTYLEMVEARQRGRKELEAANLADKTLTCDECAHFTVCQWAFDTYNTDGDCLDLK